MYNKDTLPDGRNVTMSERRSAKIMAKNYVHLSLEQIISETKDLELYMINEGFSTTTSMFSLHRRGWLMRTNHLEGLKKTEAQRVLAEFRK